MAALIDSSVFITLERQGLRLSALANAVGDEPIALASISAAELLVGVHRANSSQRRLNREGFVEAIFEAMPVVQFDLPVARVHALIAAQLAAAGQLVGAHDLLIAATARAHGYAVVTDNLREFQRVPGLVVRQPTW